MKIPEYEFDSGTYRFPWVGEVYQAGRMLAVEIKFLHFTVWRDEFHVYDMATMMEKHRDPNLVIRGAAHVDGGIMILGDLDLDDPFDIRLFSEIRDIRYRGDLEAVYLTRYTKTARQVDGEVAAWRWRPWERLTVDRWIDGAEVKRRAGG